MRIGPRIEAEAAPGLVVGGPEGLYAVAVVRRQVREAGPGGGMVSRAWDMLIARDMANGGRRIWAGFPATMPPPERGQGPEFEQRHLLTVHSVLGHHVGLTAEMTQRGPEGRRRRATARTVVVPGARRATIDPGPALRAAFAGLPRAKRPDPATFDAVDFALLFDGGPVARAFAPCCGRSDGAAVSVDVPFDPAQVAGGVSAAGVFSDERGCTLEGRAGRVVARWGERQRTLGAPGSTLLGVAWVPITHPHRAAVQQRAVQTLR